MIALLRMERRNGAAGLIVTISGLRIARATPRTAEIGHHAHIAS
jgi:hypothetical protein